MPERSRMYQIGGGVAALAALGGAFWWFFIRKKTTEAVAPVQKELRAVSGPAVTTDAGTVPISSLERHAPPAPQVNPAEGTVVAPTPADPEPVIVVGAIPPDVPQTASHKELLDFLNRQDETADHPDDLDAWIKAQVEGLDPDHQIREWLEA